MNRVPVTPLIVALLFVAFLLAFVTTSDPAEELNASTDFTPVASTSTTETATSSTTPTSTSAAAATTTTTSITSASTTSTSTTTTVAVDPNVLRIASGTSGEAPASGVRSYRVEVEAATGLDPAEVAEFVDDVLQDPRSWAANGGPSLGRTDGELANDGFRIIFASPETVDRLCFPLDTAGYFSCRNGERVVLNAERWANAVPDWATTLTEYREYLVNHEVGHALGFGHVDCPGPGELAPVMMQQSKTNGACAPNSWPHP